MPRPEPSPTDGFDFAIEHDNLDEAWGWAHQMRRVAPHRALRLTILAGIQGDKSYDAAAKRFLQILLAQCDPSLNLVELTAQALKMLGDQGTDKLSRAEVRDGLRMLADHLERGDAEKWEGPEGPHY